MQHAVETATGPVPVEALGRTLAHEHVVVLNTELQSSHPGTWDEGRWEEERGIAIAAAKLMAVKAAGFDTLVDVTVFPMGRDAARVAAIARASGMQIVVATGLYVFDTLPRPVTALPRVGDEDPIERLFVRDIVDGIAGTGIRAAVVKLASDRPGLTPDVERILRAGARAHRRTGAPITTHSNPALHGGLDQQRVLAAEGVDLGRVVIGHCGDTDDLDYLERLIDAGSYIGMDRFGMHDRIAPEARIRTVAALCERGYADRMVLSHDAWAFNDWISAELAASLPDWHYLHIADAVLPALADAGVSERDVGRMLVDNPRTLFENALPY